MNNVSKKWKLETGMFFLFSVAFVLPSFAPHSLHDHAQYRTSFIAMYSDGETEEFDVSDRPPPQIGEQLLFRGSAFTVIGAYDYWYEGLNYSTIYTIIKLRMGQ